MFKRVCIGLMVVMALPTMVLAQSSTTPASPAAGSDDAVKFTAGGRNAAIHVLRKPIASVDWEEATPEFVFEWVRDQGAVNVIANWTALGVEAVDTEQPFITLRMRNTSVAEILNEVMSQLAESGSVRYRAGGNTIRISTEQDFNRKLYVKVYNVTDILFRVQDFNDAPEIDLQRQQTGQTGGQGGGSSETVFSGGSGGGSGDDEVRDEEIQERLEELREVIEQSISPESWDTTGGKSTIRVYNRMLIVRSSIEVHEEIAGRFSFGD